jgi:hypothetical protein
MQGQELYDHPKQEDDDGKAGAEEVLPFVQEAYAAQGDQVKNFEIGQ